MGRITPPPTCVGPSVSPPCVTRGEDGESGQSMVEFAIILPLLLLITFGTIELSVFLSRRITLTGASFLAARAATVGGQDGNDPSKAAAEVLGAYAEDSGQAWLKSVVDGSSGKLSVETEPKDRLMRVTAVKKNEQWTGLVQGGSSFFGNSLKSTIGALGTEITINREFVQGKNDRSAVQRRTDLEIDYSADLGRVGNLYSKFSAGTGMLTSLIGGFPGVGQKISGFVGILTTDPLQAVSRNPGGKSFTPGRSLAAVYASSDNEKPGYQGNGFNQSATLISNLHTASPGVRGVREALMAAITAMPTLQLPLTLTAKGLESSVTSAESALQGIERLVFGTSGAL